MSLPMNGSASTSKSPSVTSSIASTKQQSRSSNPGKSLDTTRKQAASPVDGSSARKQAPKAWTTGSNPLTQRSTPSVTPNGILNGHAKAPSSSQNATGTSSETRAHERLVFLLANFMGLDASLTLKNGEQYTGVFSGATTEPNDSRYILKMVKRSSASSSDSSNGEIGASIAYIGEGDDHRMAFDMPDVVDLNVSGVSLMGAENKTANGVATRFRTDVEISGNLSMRERELQRWEPGPETQTDLSLGGEGPSSLGAWDQFAANKQLYNVQSDYDEDLYTTTIDRTNPRYREIERKAAQMAREMERAADAKKLNADIDAGSDEEDKYSGVRRDTPSLSSGGLNAYVPPSRRPPSNPPAISGAVVDPAIISSQLARSHSPTQAVVDENDSTKPSTASALTQPSVSSIEDTAKSSLPPQTPVITSEEPSAAAADVPAKAGPITPGPFQDVYESFKAFTSAEKLRLQQHQRAVQQQRSSNARQEKSVKLNDLKKFSQNFKLHSRVPEDLVPILAKSKDKQDEIRDKAESHAKEKEQRDKDKVVSPQPTKSQAEQKSQAVTPSGAAGQGAEAVAQASNRQRANQQPRAQNGIASVPRGPSLLSQRGAQNQGQYRAGLTNNVPPPLPIQTIQPRPPSPSNAAESGLTSPTSALSSRFNVNAKSFEFKPNPAASTFTPVGPGADSKRPSVSGSTRGTTPKPVKFFSANKKPKPSKDRKTVAKSCNPTERMARETDEQKKSQFAANGGIPQAYRTPPVWDFGNSSQDKGYIEFFPKAPNQSATSPMHRQSSSAIAHQHQLPPHLQGGLQTSQHTPRFYASQPQHMPHMHMDEQRMQHSSSNSSVQPSPRMGHPSMAYNNQMHSQMPGYGYGMPANGMSPMHMRPMPAGGQFMGQQGSPMGGQMMVQQASNGPYMNGPMPQQMNMFPSPGPNHAQPHFGGQAAQHGMPTGYAGSPRAYPMSHQGSQQGHAPQGMYMIPGQQGPMMMPQHAAQMTPLRSYGQPAYQAQHPQHTQHPYAMQHRAMSGGGFNQPTPRQQHAMPQQGHIPGAVVPTHSSTGEEPR